MSEAIGVCHWCVNPLLLEDGHPHCWRHIREQLAEIDRLKSRVEELEGALRWHQKSVEGTITEFLHLTQCPLCTALAPKEAPKAGGGEGE